MKVKSKLLGGGGGRNQALPGTKRAARPQARATQRFPGQPKPQPGITESWIVGAVTEEAPVAQLNHPGKVPIQHQHEGQQKS